MSKDTKTLKNAAIYVLVFILIYNLIDYILSAVITRTGFSFHWATHILAPALGGLIYSLLKMKMMSRQKTETAPGKRSGKRPRKNKGR